MLWLTTGTGTWPVRGPTRKIAAIMMITAWPMPKLMNAAWKPELAIIAWIGATVSAEPAPKPAAVMPAASPRLSGNHFRALPTQVPYTAPAPMPAITWPI